jgi:hypothetical protein
MSILLEEPSLYPEGLLDFDARRPTDRRWWVLHTHARQEKALIRDLLTWRIPFYLPLVRQVSVNRGRRGCARVPLFSGCVFMFGTDDERVRSLTTNRVSQTLPVDDPQPLLFDLRQLWRLIASNVPLTRERRLIPGNPVRVRHGPLAGLEGTVFARRGQTRLLVQVSFLQQGVSLDVDAFLLEPAD